MEVPRSLRILYAQSALALALGSTSQAQTIAITGIVKDKDYPVRDARVRVSGPLTSSWLDSTVTDSTGRFQVTLEFQPGCHRLQVRWLGYAVTERTFSVVMPGVRELGPIPLHGAPIPEWPALLLLGCAYPQAGHWPGALGTDTVRVEQ